MLSGTAGSEKGLALLGQRPRHVTEQSHHTVRKPMGRSPPAELGAEPDRWARPWRVRPKVLEQGDADNAHSSRGHSGSTCGVRPSERGLKAGGTEPPLHR